MEDWPTFSRDNRLPFWNCRKHEPCQKIAVNTHVQASRFQLDSRGASSVVHLWQASFATLDRRSAHLCMEDGSGNSAICLHSKSGHISQKLFCIRCIVFSTKTSFNRQCAVLVVGSKLELQSAVIHFGSRHLPTALKVPIKLLPN